MGLFCWNLQFSNNLACRKGLEVPNNTLPQTISWQPQPGLSSLASGSDGLRYWVDGESLCVTSGFWFLVALLLSVAFELVTIFVKSFSTQWPKDPLNNLNNLNNFVNITEFLVICSHYETFWNVNLMCLQTVLTMLSRILNFLLDVMKNSGFTIKSESEKFKLLSSCMLKIHHVVDFGFLILLSDNYPRIILTYIYLSQLRI